LSDQPPIGLGSVKFCTSVTTAKALASSSVAQAMQCEQVLVIDHAEHAADDEAGAAVERAARPAFVLDHVFDCSFDSRRPLSLTRTLWPPMRRP
jgi:hypothetical protein